MASSDPMDTIRDILGMPEHRAPITPFPELLNDDIQSAGDDLRDADDYADYHYPIPFPPRKEDLA